MGAEEPAGTVSLYWKGKNLFFGYYPGASIVSEGVAGVIDMTACAGLFALFLLLVYPILILSVFTVKTCIFC